MASATDSQPILGAQQRIERVHGWGVPSEHAAHLAERLLRESLRRLELEPSRVHARSMPSVPESRLNGQALDALAERTPLSIDDATRVAYSLGKSYPDLLAAREPHLGHAFDAVVQPREPEALRSVLEWCADNGTSVVPVGGGTTVVGGIEPLARTAGEPVIAVDTTQLAALLDVDATSHTATVQCGIMGPDLEHVLGTWGYTLGHVPQSFERSTLGGWIAARSSGQQSLAFGRIEDMVRGLTVVSPSGEHTIPHLPAHGAGPDFIELLAGSEGRMGIIERAVVRLTQRPQSIAFASYIFGSFEEASDAARRLVQAGIRPATLRVSNADETSFTLSSALPGRGTSAVLSRFAGRRLASATGFSEGSLVFIVMPGTGEQLERLKNDVSSHMRRAGGRSLGSKPARQWYQARFNQPYARDVMMDHGLIIDTLETATTWERVDAVHNGVARALRSALGQQAVVGCHLSHMYQDGASLYFTFIAACDRGRQLERWQAAKRAVHRVLNDEHAAVSHQHGVGTMHAHLFAQHTDPLLRSAFGAARSVLDSHGICNPGKLDEMPADGLKALNRVE